jgi:hypothetical protein
MDRGEICGLAQRIEKHRGSSTSTDMELFSSDMDRAGGDKAVKKLKG